MPYFIDEKNCVRKGTKEEPGEVVQCHDEHKAAAAHLRALYVNVEDASEKLFVDVEGEWFEFVRDKGGTGSGWHGPPEGTHDAEHAPNFRGGPGKDRTYGTEREEAPEGSKLCKCTKCNSTFTLPKGKQCRDVACPGCGGKAEQTTPRKDKPEEGREGGSGKKEVDCPTCEEEKAVVGDPGPTIHGEGGAIGDAAAVMDDGEESGKCKCPKCGKSLPCAAKACPYCKENVEPVRAEGEKRAMKSEGDGEHPASHYLVVEDPEKTSTWHLRVRNAKGELDHSLMGGAWAALHGGYRGNKYEGPKKAEALAKLKELYKREGMSTPGEKSIFTCYKSASGAWRWLSISNWAVVDKEAEVVTEQAYRDAIAHAQKSGAWGELDLVHVNGTDCGDCDMMFVLKSGDEPAKLGAGGTWHDTDKASRVRRAIQAEPDHWGMSVKFRFNPQRKVRGVYTGDIQVLKHTILPQHMAASHGTAIAVQGGESMSKVLDEKTADALRQLGHTEDEIAELAEKNKASPPEENVAEKEESTEVGAQEQGLIDRIKRLLGVKAEAPVASEPEEAESDKEVVAPAETEQEVVAEKAGADPEALKALGLTVAQVVGDAVRVELEKRDVQIGALQEQVKALAGTIEEKVEARLRDVPTVVKVAASQVDATAVLEPVKGLRFGQSPEEAEKWVSTLVADIGRVVEQKTKGAGFTI